MRNLGLLFFSVCCIASCAKKTTVTNQRTPPPVTITPPPTTPKTYQLVWSDEFIKDGIPDSTKWTYETGGDGWGNHELEYYTARPENARVAGGNLIIEARKERYLDRIYTSARLITRNKAQWTYGKFDIKAKIPKGIGTWPAIWLLSAQVPLSWPTDGELDIMEEVGYRADTIFGTAHNQAYHGGNGKGGYTAIKDAQDSFHIYSIEWTPQMVQWSVDSIPYYTYRDPGLGHDGWPYNKDFFMILNIAVGGDWGGAQGVDASVFPQQMLVDYVRVYQLK
ncbi:MAG: hypothetical protein NVS1B13_03330 [Flavisolibacter sp.]